MFLSETKDYSRQLTALVSRKQRHVYMREPGNFFGKDLTTKASSLAVSRSAPLVGEHALHLILESEHFTGSLQPNRGHEH